MNNLLFAVMVVLLATVAAFIVALVMLRNDIKELKDVCEFVHAIQKSDNKILDSNFDILSQNEKHLQNISEYVNAFTKASDEGKECLLTQYGVMEEHYTEMVKTYKEIIAQHKKILKAWEKVEDRYSDCYDVLDHLNEAWDIDSVDDDDDIGSEENDISQNKEPMASME